MRRRELLALAAVSAAWRARGGRAQVQRDRPTIGYIAGGKRAVVADLVAAFQKGMHELGWIEGSNIDILYRFAEAQPDRVAPLADELVRLKPALILAGAVDTAVAVRKLTNEIPIVSPALADVVHLGLVASVARPGGNVTGITPYIAGLPAKQLELARAIVPGAAVIGVLGNLNDPKAPPQLDELQAAGRAVEAKVLVADVPGPDNIVGAMRRLAESGAEVVIVLQTTMLLSERQQIAIGAAANRLPAIYGYRQHVTDGGLISYGVDLRWCFHRAATLVHKILNGTPAGELPLEFPTKVEMIVNLRTAKALGLAIPTTVLARADEIIE